MFNKRCKRGQSSGAGAAALVALITILIILYVMFLPAEERQKYIDTDDDSSTSSSSSDEEYEVGLLLKHPGRMDYISINEIDHDLPSVTLLTKKEGAIVEEKNSVYAKNALFNKLEDTMEFEIDELDNVDNILLSFNIKDKGGRLIVNLNDIEVFNQEIKGDMADPIRLQNKYLDHKNVLTFQVSSPGVAFWATNQYILEDVKVTADLTKTEGQTATLKFIADSQEKNNVNRVRVKFVPDCVSAKAKPLSVTLNNQEIFSGIPDCGSLVSQEFLPYYLVEGENVLEIKAESSYLIDRVQVTSRLKKPRDFVYDFNINSTIYEDMKDGKTKINLTIEFDDDDEEKEAMILINGRKSLIDQDEREFSKIIDYYVNKDYNYIKIVPKSSMYMTKLEIKAINEED